MKVSVNKSKVIFTSLFTLNLILSFQNCGPKSFQTVNPSSLKKTDDNFNSELNLPSESDSLDVNLPIENILPGENVANESPLALDSTNTTGKSYYMSPAGNDTNPGTLSSPWKTLDRLQAAQAILKPGDTVYFRGGNYVINDSSKNSIYDFSAKGTASARIIYKNYDKEIPVILYDRRIINTSNHRIALLPGEYNTFDGLTFRQSEASRCLALEKDCTTRIDKARYYEKSVRAMHVTKNYVTIRNCIIDNFTSIGLGTPGSYIVVEYSTFKNISNHLLYLQGPYGKFRYNNLDGSRQLSDGGVFGVQIQYLKTHHNIIHNNVIRNTSAGAVVFSGQVSYNEMYNNVLINSGDKRPSGKIVSTWTEDGPLGVKNKFYNNTAIGKTKSNVFGGKITEFSKIEIRDNIFYPSSKINTGLTQNYTDIQNNIFYNISNAAPSGNISKDPLLANPLGITPASAMLKSGSTAINAGKSSIFPKIDYNNRTRPQGGIYDIGAFEY